MLGAQRLVQPPTHLTVCGNSTRDVARAFSLLSRESSRLSLMRVLFAALLFCATLPALAQVRGMYSPGSTLIQAGSLGNPGFGYNNQFWYNSSTQLIGPEGKPLPITGSISIRFDNNTFSYIPKFKFLGATVQFTVDVAFSNGNYAAIDPFTGGPGVRGGGAGLTNTNFVPFSLGWHLKRADIEVGYGVYAPTGYYKPGASNNVSSGFWTNTLQTGATMYLTKSKATQVSLYNEYAWNTIQQGTMVRPGQNDSLDYSLTRTFSLDKSGKWSLQAGPAGYGQWQTTHNTGQLPVREALEYRINGAGFTTNLSAPHGISVGVSALWEYGARNTYQGHTVVVTASFTL